MQSPAGKAERGNDRTPPTDARRAEVAAWLEAIRSWAPTASHIRAIALAGSWSHGDATMASDVDMVVLCAVPDAVDTLSMPGVSGLRFLRTMSWGGLTECRYVTATGLELDIGMTSLSWADIDPVDDGTRQVVTDGITALYDPDGRLARLNAACR